MTSFDDLRSVVNEQRKRRAELARSTTFTKPFLGKPELRREEEAWWEDAFYVMGKIEELEVKAVGRLLTDDPKYSRDSTGLRDQIWFGDLMQSAGVENPILASVLGTGLAIANPFDLLNKLKVMKLTRAGVTAQKVSRASQFLTKGADGLYTLDRSALNAALKSAEEGLEKLSGRARKQAKRRLGNVRDIGKTQDSLSNLLKSAQKQGVDIKDIKLAPTWWEQARDGQRRILGMAPITSLEHVPFMSRLSRTRDQLSEASGSLLALGYADRVPVADDVMRTIDSATFKTARGIKKGIGKVLSPLADRIGAGNKNKELVDSIFRMVGQSANMGVEDLEQFIGEIKHGVRELEKAGHSREEILSVMDGLETQGRFVGAANDNDVRTVRDVIESTVTREDDLEKAVLKTQTHQLDPKDAVEAPGSHVRVKALSESEIDNALMQYATGEAPSKLMGGDLAVRQFGRYRVVELDRALTDQQMQVFHEVTGLPKWEQRVKDKRPFLVSRVLENSEIPASFTGADSELRTGSLILDHHIYNLQVTAAQLAERGIAIMPVGAEDVFRATDFAISRAGRMEIVNPKVLKQLKGKDKVDKARLASANSIYNLGRDLGLVNETAQLHHLASKSAMHRLARRGAAAVELRKGPAPSKTGDTFPANPQNILHQAVNTTIHADYVDSLIEGDAKALAELDDFAKSNAIVDRIQEYDQAIARGQRPVIEPIEIGVDDYGRMQIQEGRDRLTAAAFLGIDNVPIKRTTFVGDEIDNSKFFTNAPNRMVDVFHDDTVAASDIIGSNPEFVQQGVLSENYKISRGGRYGKIESSDFIVDSELDHHLATLYSISKGRPGGKADIAMEPVTKALANTWEKKNIGLIKVAEAAEQEEDVISFLSRIENEMGFANTELKRPELRAAVQNQYDKIRAVSVQHLDELASRGVFSETSLLDRFHLYDGVIEHLDPSSSSLTILSGGRSVEDLTKYADDMLHNRGVPTESIVPNSRVTVRGNNGELDLRVRHFVKERTTSKLEQGIPRPRPRQISDAAKEELRGRGVAVVTSKNDLEGAKASLVEAGLHGPSGHLLDPLRATEGSTRSMIRMWLTDGDELFIGLDPKHQNQTAFLKAIYKEGKVGFGEQIVVARDGINYLFPLGGSMKELSKNNVKRLENRLRMVASKLRDLGLADDYILNVEVPFRKQGWEQFYGKNRTLKQVSSPKFKLDIPEKFIGRKLDTHIDAVDYKADFVRPQIPGQLGKFVDTLRKIGDELYAAEAQLAINKNFIAPYFPRILSAEGRAALGYIKANEKMSDAFARLKKGLPPRTIKDLGNYMKKRVFTDMRTSDVEEILRRLRKGRVQGISKEDLHSSVMDLLVREGDFEAFDTIAQAMNAAGIEEGATFFVTNPAMAFAIRARQSISSQTSAAIMQSMKDMNVGWVGTKAELAAAKTARKSKEVLLRKVDSLNREVTKLENDLELLKADTTGAFASKVEEAEKALSKAKDKRGRVLADIVEKDRVAVKGKGAQATDIDLENNVIYAHGSRIRELIRGGTIDDKAILVDAADDLVKLETTKVINTLGDADEVLILPKEVEPALDRYFGTRRGNNQFLRFYDQATNLFKSWTLFPIPAYHTRNLLSNLWMMWMGGVSDFESLRTGLRMSNLLYKRSHGHISLADANRVLDETIVYSDLGQSATLREVYESFVSEGGSGHSFLYNEFKKYSGGDQVAQETAALFSKVGATPSSSVSHELWPVRKGKGAAMALENWSRFSTFYDFWKKTGDPRAAMMEVKKILYDYRDLTMFERSVMKRIYPFYSWSRFNIPRMVQLLATEPIRVYRFQKMVEGIEKGVRDDIPKSDDDYAEWMKRAFGIIVAKEGDNYLVRAGEYLFPMYEMMGFFGGGSLTKAATDRVSPFLKVPYETVANYNTFLEREIEEFPGQRAKSPALAAIGIPRRPTTEGPIGPLGLIFNEHFWNNVRLFKMGTDSINNFLLDEGWYKNRDPRLTTVLLDYTLGRAHISNPTQNRLDRIRRKKFEVSKLKAMITNFEKRGYHKDAADARKILINLQFGYP